MPNVTAFVPSFQHAQFVERTLRSIFAQTLPPQKLIVIDDGSKDESVEIIRRVLEDCPFENIFIARDNRGLCTTLNEALSLAAETSEYFAYLGSDDIWLPNFLEKQVDLLMSRPDSSLAFSHAFVIDEDDNIIDRTDNWSPFADGDLLEHLLRGEIMSSPGIVYRFSELKEFGWNENAKLEDYELYLRLAINGEFARNEEILCAWRRHGNNTSSETTLMLSEQIAAQEMVFPELNISREKLREFQGVLKLNTAAELIRNCDKRTAWRLIKENYEYSNFGSLIKNLFRLLTPRKLFMANRERMRKANIAKYGKLKY